MKVVWEVLGGLLFVVLYNGWVGFFEEWWCGRRMLYIYCLVFLELVCYYFMGKEVKMCLGGFRRKLLRCLMIKVFLFLILIYLIICYLFIIWVILFFKEECDLVLCLSWYYFLLCLMLGYYWLCFWFILCFFIGCWLCWIVWSYIGFRKMLGYG